MVLVWIEQGKHSRSYIKEELGNQYLLCQVNIKYTGITVLRGWMEKFLPIFCLLTSIPYSLTLRRIYTHTSVAYQTLIL